MSPRADLRIAVEPGQDGQPVQRIYLNGQVLPAARRVRVNSEWGQRTASLDVDLGDVSIDPRTVSELRSGRGDDQIDITVEADTVDGSVRAHLMPAWTRGQAPAHRRPDVFDRARDCYAHLARVDWLVLFGVTYLVITVLGVFMEHAVLEYASGLRQPSDDE